MPKTISAATLVASFCFSCLLGSAQSDQPRPTTEQSIPASTQVLLEGVRRPGSKAVVKAVLMVICRKEGSKGTGFVLSDGHTIATNAHVVKSCNAGELELVFSASDDNVRVLDIKRDQNRDLAILCMDKTLPFGLTLGNDEQPPIETEVETWGYPLRYEGRAPILSRGYVAGYSRDALPAERGGTGLPVSRLIINGAFNPGNSGGPLIDRTTGRVIGVVVEKWTLWSPLIESAINGLAHSSTQTGGTFSRNGVPISNEEVMSVVLKEFYEQSQVMIGNAISVSELNAFTKPNPHTSICDSPH